MPTVEQPSAVPHGICQPGCIRLSAYLRIKFGGGNSGCYNPNSVLKPSGKPSFHVDGQAIDIGLNWFDMKQREIGNQIFAWTIQHADELNLQQTIWGNHIISASDWHDGVQNYTRDDHKNHVHIAIGRNASRNWKAPTGTSKPPEDTVEHGMAVDVTVNPDDPTSGYTLSRWGSIHPFGKAKPATIGAGWPGVDIARRIVITDWAKPAGFVMDLAGGLHGFGGWSAPAATKPAYWKNFVGAPFNEV